MSLSTAYLFTQVPSAAVAYWAFKLHQNKFKPTYNAPDFPKTFNEFIHHDPKGGIFGAGVCQLGKVGAWVILITLFVTFILIILGESGYNKYNEQGDTTEASKHLKNYVLSVIITNSIIFGIVLILSTLMNPPLFVRSVPFYSLQLGILFNLGYVYSKNNS